MSSLHLLAHSRLFLLDSETYWNSATELGSETCWKRESMRRISVASSWSWAATLMISWSVHPGKTGHPLPLVARSPGTDFLLISCSMSCVLYWKEEWISAGEAVRRWIRSLLQFPGKEMMVPYTGVAARGKVLASVTCDFEDLRFEIHPGKTCWGRGNEGRRKGMSQDLKKKF